MAKSFALCKQPVAVPTGQPLRVLVTGAAGNVGRLFVKHAIEQLSDRVELKLMLGPGDSAETEKDLSALATCVRGDIASLDDMKLACESVDVILHLAANPNLYAVWSELMPPNIAGAYNVFAAAKQQGVRRVVFASSIAAVTGYRRDRQISPEDPVNPGNLYGVTKCFGEAMARYMAEQEDVQALVVRIGHVNEIEHKNVDAHLDHFLSPSDLCQLLEKTVLAEHVQFAIVHGISDNAFKRLDIETARDLFDYQPADDSVALHPTTRAYSERMRYRDYRIPNSSGLREDVSNVD